MRTNCLLNGRTIWCLKVTEIQSQVFKNVANINRVPLTHFAHKYLLHYFVPESAPGFTSIKGTLIIQFHIWRLWKKMLDI